MSIQASTNEPIIVGMGFDSNYAKHAGVAIASVVKETRSAPVEFVIVHEGVSPELRRQVEACGRGAKFTWFEIANSRLLKFSGVYHISRATFFRFALTEVLPPECTRILYLDCDLVVLRDLEPLWRFDLRGAPLAAVADPGVDPVAFARLWDLPEDKGGYFNAGVLLLDIARIRADCVFERAVSVLESQWSKITLLDQDALNVVVWGSWAQLDVVWNMQMQMYRPSDGNGPFVSLDTLAAYRKRKPAIVHYSGGRKPWTRYNYHPLSGLYYKYLALTPFKREVIRQSKTEPARIAFWRSRALWRLLGARP